jgi:hypothetical protein
LFRISILHMSSNFFEIHPSQFMYIRFRNFEKKQWCHCHKFELIDHVLKLNLRGYVGLWPNDHIFTYNGCDATKPIIDSCTRSNSMAQECTRNNDWKQFSAGQNSEPCIWTLKFTSTAQWEDGVLYLKLN